MAQLSRINFLLTGVTFETRNMGVHALADGAVSCIRQTWPQATIQLLDYGKAEQLYWHDHHSQRMLLRLVPIRFSKNILLANNIALLIALALLSRLLPPWIAKRLLDTNHYLRTVANATALFALAGGDSFSDIYGLPRFLYVTLPMVLGIILRTPLILLPQTFGPYRHRLSRVLARHILSRATALYSRDQHGIHTVAALFYKRHTAPAVVKGFDVAFLVPPQPPAVMPSLLLRRDTMRIGINISGLLAMGGYNRLNMFGLKTDYTIMIHALIDLLIRHTSAELVLIPHVSGTQQHAESDYVACSTIQSQINLPSYSRRICSIDSPCTHRQIKYLIGSCALFFGSRMHACIAALSQTVPAVGLAYSDKFLGVFDTLELGELVIDLRTSSLPQILQQTDSILAKREALQQHLVRTIPKIEHSLHTMMGGITLRSIDTDVSVKQL